MSTLEFNDQFKQAIFLMEKTNHNVFITGKAGSGKTTALNYFKENTTKNVAVLAPTGVAALNVNGQTIHSFCGFRPGMTVENVYRLPGYSPKYKIVKNIDTVVIDEISMVRVDLLDCLEKFFRLNGKRPYKPFGGVQMIFIGDMFQLPPVVKDDERFVFSDNLYKSPYFFDSKALEKISMEFIELEKIYRQSDNVFISLLNAIRTNEISDHQLDLLNSRCNPRFETDPNDTFVHLTTTRAAASSINEEQLGKLDGTAKTFKGYSTGKFEKNHFPTDENLKLKINAQIMILVNDPFDRWVNGTVGKVTDFKRFEGQECIEVILESGQRELIQKHTWDLHKIKINEKNPNKIEYDSVGSYTQFPIKLGWASTIHKAQGKTFDKVLLDLNRGTFAHGQLYVALSRCTSLEGLVLKKPILRDHILTDDRVIEFYKNFCTNNSNKTVREIDPVLEEI